MGLTTFGVVSAGSLTDTWDPTSQAAMSQAEVGTIQVVKRFTSGGVAEFSIAKVVKMHATTRCTVGDVLMHSTVSVVGGIATVGIVAQDGQPILGLAAASIASGRCGYAIIGGIATSTVSQICTAGDFLSISGSSAAQLSNNRGSGFGVTTLPLTSSFVLVARAYNAASVVSVGSIITVRLLQIWG